MTEIYDENMVRLESGDPEKGWIRRGWREVRHEAVEGVQEQWHYEIERSYANGGKDVRRVIDVPGREAKAAWTERIPIWIYHPYTEAELASWAALKSRPSPEERMERLEAALAVMQGNIRGLLEALTKREA